MSQIYTIENNEIVEHDLDEVRASLNHLNGCPMPSGNCPLYEMREEIEYRVMQVGEHGYADHQYSVRDSEYLAQSDLDDVVEDEPYRPAWIDKVPVYVLGTNERGRFHEFARYESESGYMAKLDACLDDLVENNEQVSYYWSREQAQAQLDEQEE